MIKPDTEAGLYQKYKVTRLDGSSRKGKKHRDCYYFVLDTTHDPHTIPALAAYAESCKETHPHLYADLKLMLKNIMAGTPPKADHA